jgi:Na+-transporting NADH:ubiquinone oxidoreductase subunit A
MSKTVKLRKGLDIKLVGEAEKVMESLPMPSEVALKPADFHGMVPKMVLKEGEKVKAGEVVFHDKYNESIKYVSPVSGTIKSIVRGEKRRILSVVITADSEIQYASSSSVNVNDLNGEQVKEKMLAAGLWPFVKQRPIDVVANPNVAPKAIFISGFDSSPLAPDYNFLLEGKEADFQTGIDALAKLTSGSVHLGLNGQTMSAPALLNAKGVQMNRFYGKHPIGNVGTQIHHIDPINKGEMVWTINALDVAMIGKYFNTGKFDATRTIALCGSEVSAPKYFTTVLGAQLTGLLDGKIKDGNVRYISGNVLTGDKVEKDGYLGAYHHQVTVIPEGNEYKFFLSTGWLGHGFDKFSNSRLFPTWLLNAVAPNKKYRLDTNTNGEERAFVVTGELDRVFPFDIMPMQLVKAAITKDIDGMENLGIYEVAPEDFALCEYVCTTKINIQDEVRNGLDLINEECM